MISLVLSGGQTGADWAAWKAARRCSIPCSGWMPRGFLTESGPKPEYARSYGAKEHTSPEYPPRTAANVNGCDCVLWLGDPRSPGGRLTQRLAHEMERFPISVVSLREGMDLHAVLGVIVSSHRQIFVDRPYTLLVAGNRESSAPGIGAMAEEFCVRLFTLLGHPEIQPQEHAVP